VPHTCGWAKRRARARHLFAAACAARAMWTTPSWVAVELWGYAVFSAFGWHSTDAAVCACVTQGVVMRWCLAIGLPPHHSVVVGAALAAEMWGAWGSDDDDTSGSEDNEDITFSDEETKGTSSLHGSRFEHSCACVHFYTFQYCMGVVQVYVFLCAYPRKQRCTRFLVVYTIMCKLAYLHQCPLPILTRRHCWICARCRDGGRGIRRRRCRQHGQRKCNILR
jgi:hypothetical protein